MTLWSYDFIALIAFIVHIVHIYQFKIIYQHSEKGITPVGTSATLKCDEGLVPAGISVLICTNTGWYPHGTLGQCVPNVSGGFSFF